MWTKSCGITIQMKPLQWYFYMVLLFFSISQIETENFLGAPLDKNMWTKSNHAVWSFKWNLFCSIFTWYFLFFSVVQSEITLCFFGSVRLIIMFRVYELICPRCRSFPWTHLLKKLFNMCFSEGRQAFVSFTIFTETIMHLVPHPHPTPPPKKKLHNHCLQFVLGITVVPREIEDNATF